MEELVTVLLILPLVIVAKNLLGAGKGIQEHEFEWAILKQGLFKGLLIYAGIGVLALITVLAPDLVVFVGGIELGLVEGLVLVITGAIVVYLADVFTILLEIFRQPTKEVEYIEDK